LLALPDLLLPQIHRQIAVHSNHDYQIYWQPITAKWCVSVKEQQFQCRHSQIWSSKIVVVAGVLLLFYSHHDNNIPIRSTISAVNNPLFFFWLLLFFQGYLFRQRIKILV
jgi:hypothetical protein